MNAGALGGQRIVGDHQDGLAELGVELAEQGQDVVRALAVEVAGGLVRHDDLRVVHDGARDGHALLLTTRELARVVAHALFETDHAQGRLGALLALLGAQLGEQAAAAPRSPSAVSTGIRLYCWKMKPSVFERNLASALSSSLSRS